MEKNKRFEDVALPEEARERIRRVAARMIDLAFELTGGQAVEMVGALTLATSNAWAMSGFEFQPMSELMSTYYTAALVREAEAELAAAGARVAMIKMPEGQQ